MLARMRAYGPRGVALATYEVDFIAVRQRSLNDGSLFAFKSISDEDDGGYYGCKGNLWDYIGVVFGKVDEVVIVPGHDTFVRLITPDCASCGARHLFHQQGDTLQSILDMDTFEVGGSVLSSFFDYGQLHAGLSRSDDGLYIRGNLNHCIERRNAFLNRKNVAIKVRFTRHNVCTGNDVSGRNYSLEMVSYDSFRMEDSGLSIRRNYVCDENGSQGLYHCSACPAFNPDSGFGSDTGDCSGLPHVTREGFQRRSERSDRPLLPAKRAAPGTLWPTNVTGCPRAVEPRGCLRDH
ncbi:hypothetical protein B0H14DRAFT_2598177 [Mycena olivaceomarginata]|nr:hypothetical protein B0H14DRAFT_2598177 [Mycena olivaceomarginata]